MKDYFKKQLEIAMPITEDIAKELRSKTMYREWKAGDKFLLMGIQKGNEIVLTQLSDAEIDSLSDNYAFLRMLEGSNDIPCFIKVKNTSNV